MWGPFQVEHPVVTFYVQAAAAWEDLEMDVGYLVPCLTIKKRIHFT